MSGIPASVVFALWSAVGIVGKPQTTPPDPIPHPPPQRAWIGAGLGFGTWPYGSLSGIASGWYARGPVAIGARTASTGEWFGEQRGDRALLPGRKRTEIVVSFSPARALPESPRREPATGHAVC